MAENDSNTAAKEEQLVIDKQYKLQETKKAMGCHIQDIEG